MFVEFSIIGNLNIGLKVVEVCVIFKSLEVLAFISPLPPLSLSHILCMMKERPRGRGELRFIPQNKKLWRPWHNKTKKTSLPLMMKCVKMLQVFPPGRDTTVARICPLAIHLSIYLSVCLSVYSICPSPKLEGFQQSFEIFDIFITYL